MTEQRAQTIDIPVIGLGDTLSAKDVSERLRALDGLTDIEVDTTSERIRFRLKNPGSSNGIVQKALDVIKKAGLKISTSCEDVDIFNMRCAACVLTIENGLKKLPGISDARVNFATQTGRVELIPGVYDRKDLIKDIHDIGYEAGFQKTVRLKRDVFVAAVCSIAVFVLHAGQHLANLFVIPAGTSAAIQFVLTLPVIYAGRLFFSDAWLQTKHFRTNMNSLIALGSGSAFIYSAVATVLIFAGKGGIGTAVYFDTTAMIITFILIGRFLEAKATQEARDAATGMASLIPQKVVRVGDNGEEEIDIAELQISETVVVRPGASIPADGVIVDGETTIDESLITGESMPVTKKLGDSVTGGTVNTGNGIKMKVLRMGTGSVLGRMIRMVREAQSEKAPIQRLADRVAGVFVPFVIGAALITLIVWAIFDPGSRMILIAPVAVLLVACPCAMGLATPTAILVGTGRAARMGILFRSGGILEKLTKVTTVVFDKTGTLTEGKPLVHRMLPAEGTRPETLLQIVASAEQLSEHPFAAAVRARARKDGIKFLKVDSHENKPGQGLTAVIEGRNVVIGSGAFVSENGLPPEQAKIIKQVGKDEGTAVVYVAVDGNYLGAISFTDTLKTGAAETIAQLHQRGVETIMLTGDNPYSAASVAAKLGITRVEADALPETKLTTIRSLKQTGRMTAMVGDGVNDAAALTAADIGISLGTGTDIAVKASDITVTGQTLDTVLTAFDISRATLRIIKQNLFWAFFYNVIMIPVAAGVFYPVFGLIFSPVLAAAAMAMSSVFVVSNSLRLKKLQPTHVVSLKE
jgi:Cu+-exporting ATPase